jgi:hypothetical protein
MKRNKSQYIKCIWAAFSALEHPISNFFDDSSDGWTNIDSCVVVLQHRSPDIGAGNTPQQPRSVIGNMPRPWR